MPLACLALTLARQRVVTVELEILGTEEEGTDIAAMQGQVHIWRMGDCGVP